MIPADKHQSFMKDFDASLPAFYDSMASDYMQIYTHDELKEMIVFYNSAVGMKIASQSVPLLEKTQNSSKKWADGLKDKLLLYMK